MYNIVAMYIYVTGSVTAIQEISIGYFIYLKDI